MELNFRSVGSESQRSGKPFSPGDIVASFLYQGDHGVAERYDVLEDESEESEVPGPIICKWRQRIRAKDESEAEARRNALQSAEELFLSFYEEKEGEEETPEATDSIEVMKFFLALHLERKRVLRQVGAESFRHIKSKKVYQVPQVDITDEAIVHIHGQLSNLVGL